MTVVWFSSAQLTILCIYLLSFKNTQLETVTIFKNGIWLICQNKERNRTDVVCNKLADPLPICRPFTNMLTLNQRAPMVIRLYMCIPNKRLAWLLHPILQAWDDLVYGMCVCVLHCATTIWLHQPLDSEFLTLFGSLTYFEYQMMSMDSLSRRHS